MDIKDKVIWVTGGCSGMGLASTKMFLSNGAKVMVTDINEDAGKKLDQELGKNMIFVKADMTVTAELQAAARTAVDKWGRLDVLLGCAGGGVNTWTIPMEPNPQRLAEGVVEWEYVGSEPGSIEDFKGDIAINLIGNFDAGRLAAWEMKKNEPNEDGERGVIIFISSISATTRHSPGINCGYSSAKAGLLGLAKEMACNLGPLGIRVNNIIPGYFDTPLVQDLGPLKAAWLEAQIFPKKPGNPDNIASMAAQIIENPFMNNAVVEVTAGFTATESFYR